MDFFCTMDENDLTDVNGGNGVLVVIGAACVVYEACNIVYNFGKGISDGYHGK
ncbi:hypothetical protein [Clostridium cellulovorans]|uniref:Uncharacterized protein n=1 Tax=Clostridium cellulovorans (strain ATCC 35296 / DSM 3052 / OCM 3 / 743B) TaxID=573061 RepID=D9SR24_CLOC7|nr:hypothetical protein [Clostridium cellulovorans]ADL50312.1 hypothetical protein Clocel_0538 [Clostridium cellulovorans 743B]